MWIFLIHVNRVVVTIHKHYQHRKFFTLAKFNSNQGALTVVQILKSTLLSVAVDVS